MPKPRLLILTTGGTIDKIYFDKLSEYQVGQPSIGGLLRRINAAFDFEVKSLLSKDSLELTDADRELIRSTIAASDYSKILITHGTDTMTVTAATLATLPGKTIVLTGAMLPAGFRDTDAEFNIGTALGALWSHESGVFLAMNGFVFPAGKVHKDRAAGQFILE